MNSIWPKGEPPVAQLIGIAMLAWALLPVNPYGYYVLLRFVICGICLYLATQAHGLNKTGWLWALGITAAIYNPIFRAGFDRAAWSAVNVATIAMLVATVFALNGSLHKALLGTRTGSDDQSTDNI